MTNVAATIAVRDFGRKAIGALARKGIMVVGVTVIPGEGPMPFANGDRGYCLNDNGTGKVRSYLEVAKMAKE